MKKILFILVLLISVFGITSCSNDDGNKEVKTNNRVVMATLDEDGNIVIKKEQISETATFISYNADGIIVSFIAVRGTDGRVRIAFNTCQSCSPSPSAYFVQIGEYFECQNCGNRFHVDKIGEESGGCNPAPVEEKEEDDETIIISAEYARTYKDNFRNWNGPKK